MPAPVARSTAGHSRSRQSWQDNAAGRNPRRTRTDHQTVSEPMNPEHIADILAMLIMASLVLIGFCAGVGWEKWATEDRKIKAEEKTLRDRMTEAARRTSEWSRDI